ncbi:MAG: oxidoreductase [Variovorax sp.]
MSAREGFLGSWLLAALLILLSPSTSAQCDRDAFLTLGGLPSPPSQGTSPSAGGLASPASLSPRLSASAATEIRAGEADWLTQAQILALPVSVIVTATDWTPVSRFEGPLLSEVLKLKASPAQTLRVYALNDYAITIPVSDLEKYAPILAHTRNGVRMKRGDFGPLFIVYPRDQRPELRAPSMAARMAWQACRIDVE